MTRLVDRLRPQWAAVAVLTVLAAIAIMIAEPDYIELQTADGAAAFVGLLDHPGRAMLGVAFDMVFSCAYAALGWIGLRAHGAGTRVAAWATAAILIGAVSDVIENAFVFVNIVQRDTLTDGWVDAMQVPGTTKWVFVPGFLVLLALIVRSARSRTD